MDIEVGWHFPPTNGGRVDGFNDPGVAHFNGAPLASLARETLQNSLDATTGAGLPVHVTFELVDLDPKSIDGDDIRRTIKACLQTAEQNEDSTACSALELALKNIQLKKIPCLRVFDRQTTGLRDDHWRALVKMQGMSHKPGVEGAGGSHGIGKYASFAVSALRTVFYWTSFATTNGGQEKFQGKSVLMSHTDKNGEETQGTGFFGVMEHCRELTTNIPKIFRTLDQAGDPIQGTSLTVMGFRETENWRQRIAASIIENFFYSIGTGKLTVLLKPDSSSDLMQIDQNTIDDWFQHLMDANKSNGGHAIDEVSLREARCFWEISKSEPSAERQDSDFGHCRLWISTNDGLPRKVAFLRRTGMLITTRQKGLLRFPGYREFVALCVFEDPEGNELLRRMENPTHDQFEPDRLREEDRERGRRALSRITNWVRSEIRKQAGPPEGGERTVLSELSVYLPDYQPEEPFDDAVNDDNDNGKEPGFAERVTVTLKPIRRVAPHKLTDENGSESEGGHGDDTGHEGGGGTDRNGNGNGNGGEGEGSGEGGTGSKGGGRVAQGIPVSAVRMLTVETSKNRFRLSFLAHADGPCPTSS